jgi:sporulation protein YlmC with PRC-barrel domain
MAYAAAINASTRTSVVGWFARRAAIYFIVALVTGALIIAGAGVYTLISRANQQELRQDPKTPTNIVPPRSVPAEVTPPPPTDDAIAQRPGNGWSFSDILGTPVFSPTGERVGSVQDLRLDQTGNATLVVTTEVGGQTVAVPFDSNSVDWVQTSDSHIERVIVKRWDQLGRPGPRKR